MLEVRDKIESQFEGDMFWGNLAFVWWVDEELTPFRIHKKADRCAKTSICKNGVYKNEDLKNTKKRPKIQS